MSDCKLRIDRCVCMNKTFAELLELARRENYDFAELSSKTGCGTNCGTCTPYIKRMLKSGEVVFEEILPPEAPNLRQGGVSKPKG